MGKEIFTNDKYINDLFLKVVNLVTQARELSINLSYIDGCCHTFPCLRDKVNNL